MRKAVITTAIAIPKTSCATSTWRNSILRSQTTHSWPNLTLPKLRSLSLRLHSKYESGLAGLLRRSQCSLEYLSYDSSCGAESHWPDILQQVSPSLKILVINTHTADDAMLWLVGMPPGTDQHPKPPPPLRCPRLHSIKYRYTNYYAGTPPVLSVIESRWNPPSHHGVARLETVTVRFKGRQYQDVDLDSCWARLDSEL